MIIKQLTEKMHEFGEAIYQSFEYRTDTMMDLLDAISSNFSGVLVQWEMVTWVSEDGKKQKQQLRNPRAFSPYYYPHILKGIKE